MQPAKKQKRYVLATGWIGEWNLGRRFDYLGKNIVCVSYFERAKDIIGAKRRQGLRAIRVRVVMEVVRPKR